MDTSRAINKLKEIDKKNKNNPDYSLGDILLIDKFERDLKLAGYSKKEIKSFSPGYYTT